MRQEKVLGTAGENNHDYLCSLGAAPTAYGESVADHGFVDASIELYGDIDRIVTISRFDAAERGGTDSYGGASKNTATDFAPVVGLAVSGDFAAEIAQTFAFDDRPPTHELNDHLNTCVSRWSLPNWTRGEGGGEGTRFEPSAGRRNARVARW